MVFGIDDLLIPILAAAAGGIASSAGSSFFSGSPAERKNVPTLLPEQMPLLKQLMEALQSQGAGGAFGQAADYYRNLMSDNPEDLASFTAPMLRQYNEEIIPGISEQFAGMGAGGLSSSGFRNAQIQGATDLSERLGALRAGLRQAGAAGLAGLGGMGLNPYSQNIQTQEGSSGFLSSIAPAVGSGIVSAISNWASPSKNTNTNTSTPTNSTPTPSAPPATPASFSTQNRVGKNTSPYQGSSSNMMSPYGYGNMGMGIPASPTSSNFNTPMMMRRF